MYRQFSVEFTYSYNVCYSFGFFSHFSSCDLVFRTRIRLQLCHVVFNFQPSFIGCWTWLRFRFVFAFKGTNTIHFQFGSHLRRNQTSKQPILWSCWFLAENSMDNEKMMADGFNWLDAYNDYINSLKQLNKQRMNSFGWWRLLNVQNTNQNSPTVFVCEPKLLCKFRHIAWVLRVYRTFSLLFLSFTWNFEVNKMFGLKYFVYILPTDWTILLFVGSFVAVKNVYVAIWWIGLLFGFNQKPLPQTDGWLKFCFNWTTHLPVHIRISIKIG